MREGCLFLGALLLVTPLVHCFFASGHAGRRIVSIGSTLRLKTRNAPDKLSMNVLDDAAANDYIDQRREQLLTGRGRQGKPLSPALQRRLDRGLLSASGMF